MENTEKENYKKAQGSAFLNFLMEIVNYAALIVSVVLTFSISMIMDMLTSTCNLTRTGICFFLNKKLQKNLKFTYNYGGDRLESLATLFCDFLLSLGSLFILGFAIYQLFVPREVSGLIIVAVVFKIVCVLADVGILVPSYLDYRKTKTKVAKTVFEGMVSSFAFDAGILLAVLLSMILRHWAYVGYVEPIISIVIAIITVIRAVKRIKSGVSELTDLTLDEPSQMKILKVINSHYEEFEMFNGINSHRFGEKIIIDLDLSFKKDSTFEDMQLFLEKVDQELQVEFPGSEVKLNIAKAK